MFKENLVQMNLRILLSLREQPLSLEQLVGNIMTKEGRLVTSLRILQEEGLIQKVDGVYQLHQASESVQNVLNLFDPWMDYFDGQHYEIAKDVAGIILTKSWGEVGVRDVLLFGSASRGVANPDDIDMLILHDGRELQEFDIDPYGKWLNWVRQSDMASVKGNMRYDAWEIFSRLGYRGDPADNLRTDDFRKERELEKDSALNHILTRVEPLGINVDRHQFAALFDVHVLSTGLFNTSEHFAGRRKEAIESCRDPTFWYTVLSTGKLYDPERHDFTMSLEDKYPGAAELFKI